MSETVETPAQEEHPYAKSLEKRGMVATWRGKRVTDLSHAELLNAYYDIANHLEAERQWIRTSIETDRAFEEAARLLKEHGPQTRRR